MGVVVVLDDADAPVFVVHAVEHVFAVKEHTSVSCQFNFSLGSRIWQETNGRPSNLRPLMNKKEAAFTSKLIHFLNKMRPVLQNVVFLWLKPQNFNSIYFINIL